MKEKIYTIITIAITATCFYLFGFMNGTSYMIQKKCEKSKYDFCKVERIIYKEK